MSTPSSSSAGEGSRPPEPPRHSPSNTTPPQPSAQVARPSTTPPDNPVLSITLPPRPPTAGLLTAYEYEGGNLLAGRKRGSLKAELVKEKDIKACKEDWARPFEVKEPEPRSSIRLRKKKQTPRKSFAPALLEAAGSMWANFATAPIPGPSGTAANSSQQPEPPQASSSVPQGGVHSARRSETPLMGTQHSMHAPARVREPPVSPTSPSLPGGFVFSPPQQQAATLGLGPPMQPPIPEIVPQHVQALKSPPPIHQPAPHAPGISGLVQHEQEPGSQVEHSGGARSPQMDRQPSVPPQPFGGGQMHPFQYLPPTAGSEPQAVSHRPPQQSMVAEFVLSSDAQRAMGRQSATPSRGPDADQSQLVPYAGNKGGEYANPQAQQQPMDVERVQPGFAQRDLGRQISVPPRGGEAYHPQHAHHAHGGGDEYAYNRPQQQPMDVERVPPGFAQREMGPQPSMPPRDGYAHHPHHAPHFGNASGGATGGGGGDYRQPQQQPMDVEHVPPGSVQRDIGRQISVPPRSGEAYHPQHAHHAHGGGDEYAYNRPQQQLMDVERVPPGFAQREMGSQPSVTPRDAGAHRFQPHHESMNPHLPQTNHPQRDTTEHDRRAHGTPGAQFPHPPPQPVPVLGHLYPQQGGGRIPGPSSGQHFANVPESAVQHMLSLLSPELREQVLASLTTQAGPSGARSESSRTDPKGKGREAPSTAPPQGSLTLHLLNQVQTVQEDLQSQGRTQQNLFRVISRLDRKLDMLEKSKDSTVPARSPFPPPTPHLRVPKPSARATKSIASRALLSELGRENTTQEADADVDMTNEQSSSAPSSSAPSSSVPSSSAPNSSTPQHRARPIDAETGKIRQTTKAEEEMMVNAKAEHRSNRRISGPGPAGIHGSVTAT